jgi:uncharacterized membrane protein YfcA
VRLAAIATAAGAFSGLFGVGGGTIIVPLLVLWFGYEHREATGTSLAAIAVIDALFVPALVVFAHQSQLEAVASSLVAVVLVALVGTWRQRSYGNPRLRDGLVIGILSPLGVPLGVLVGVLLATPFRSARSSSHSPASS